MEATTAGTPRRAPSGRGLVAAFGAVATVVFLVSLPASYGDRMRVCAREGCRAESLTRQEVAGLADIGLSQGAYAVAGLLLVTLVAGTCLLVASLLLRAAGDRSDAVQAAAVLIASGVVFAQTLPSLADDSPPARLAISSVEVAANAAFLSWLLTFPQGRFRPRWSVGLVALAVLSDVLSRVGLPLPGGVDAAVTTVGFGGVLVLLALRLRGLDPEERRRARWVVSGLGTALLTLVVATVAQSGFGVGPGSVADLGVQVLVSLGFLAVPLSVAASVVRRGLYDVGAALSRTLTYGVLTALAAGGYLVLVASAATLSLRLDEAPVMAAVVVAVALDGGHHRVRRAINRALYGTRDDPATLLARLAAAPDPTTDASAALGAGAETVREALRLPYVEIAVPGVTTRAAGTLPTGRALLPVPLLSRGVPVGELRVATRDGEPALGARDQSALDPVLGHLALLAHAAVLDAELHESRRQIITAREEERRRLRNDLHDGLGPTLGAIGLSLTAASYSLDDDPASARALLRQARRQTSEALVDVRRVVYGLRPPALDELGLPGALEAFVRGVGGDLDVVVDAEVPDRLPAAVEVAAYLVALEAVTNAVRHSGGTRCEVTLSVREGTLIVEVRDDGTPRPSARGVGLRSMEERTAELGGTLRVAADAGTVVRAVLPLEEGVCHG